MGFGKMAQISDVCRKCGGRPVNMEAVWGGVERLRKRHDVKAPSRDDLLMTQKGLSDQILLLALWGNLISLVHPA